MAVHLRIFGVVFATAAMFAAPAFVSAAWDHTPYAPGATLNPECSPTDDNCIVTSTWNTSGSNIFNASSTVSIGTSTPGATFEITGTGSGNYMEGGTSLLNVHTADESPWGLTFQNDTAGADNEVGVYLGNDGTLQFDTYTGSPLIKMYQNGNVNLAEYGSGNVGIGTSNPNSKLDVNGDLGLAGYNRYINFESDIQGVGEGGFGLRDYGGTVQFKNVGDPGWTDINNTAWEVNDSGIDYGGGNVGIGTATPHAPLSFGGALGDKTYYYDAGAGSSYGVGIQNTLMRFFTDGSGADFQFGYGGTSDNSSFNPNVTFKGNGNVGIGTASPSSKLDVVSTPGTDIGDLVASFTSNDTWQSGFKVANTSSETNWSFMVGGSTNNSSGVDVGNFGFYNDTSGNFPFIMQRDSDNVILARDGGKVGIGTANPASKLSVVGSPNSELAALIRNTSNGDSAAALLRLQADTSDSMILFLNSNERVGDGWGNTGTLRNDAGTLRLQSAGENGIDIIGGTGYVGIGYSNPGEKLQVNGRVSANSFAVGESTGDYVNDSPWYGLGRADISLPRTDDGQDASQLAGRFGINFVTENGQMVFNEQGKLGVGTDDPQSKLDVAGDIRISGLDHRLYFADGSSIDTASAINDSSIDSMGDINITSGGQMNFITGDGTATSSKLSIKNNGWLGIGTQDPTSPLDIYDDVTGQPNLITLQSAFGGDDQGPGILFRDTNQPENDGAASINAVSYDEGSAGLAFNTNDGGGLYEAMRIDSQGRVGINTDNPDWNAALTVDGDTHISGLLRVTGGSDPEAADAAYLWNQLGVGPTVSGYQFDVRTGEPGFQQDRLFVTSGGNVGIGTNDPNYLTQLVSTGGGGAYLGISNQGSNDGDRQLRIGFGNGQDYASIQGTSQNVADNINLVLQEGGGNVGIGTSSPTALLDVAGSARLASSTGDTYLNFGAGAVGESGYGVRLHAGHMQYRNTDGDWADMGSGGVGAAPLAIEASAGSGMHFVGTYQPPGGADTPLGVWGNYIFAKSSVGFDVVDKSDPTHLRTVSTFNAHVYSVIRGWSSGSTAYLLTSDGSHTHLTVVDASNPASPTQIGDLDLTDLTGYGYQYLVGSGSDIYTADNSGGLAIINVSVPSDPQLITTITGHDDGFYYWQQPYIVGSTLYDRNDSSQVEAWDISSPESPSWRGTYKTNVGNGVEHVIASSTKLYVGLNNGLMQVVDVSDPTNPTLEGTYSSTSSWFDPNVVVGSVVLGVNDIGQLESVDVSDPNAPHRVGIYNPTFGWLGWGITDGSYFYAQNNHDALEAVDVSHPQTPIAATFTGGHVGVGTTDPLAAFSVVGDGGNEPVFKSVYVGTTSINVVYASGNYVYTETNGGTIEIVDVSDSSSPHRVSEIVQDGQYLENVVVEGTELYAQNSDGQIEAFDVTDHAHPVSDTTVSADADTFAHFTVASSTIYAVDSDGNLEIIDMSTPTEPGTPDVYDASGNLSTSHHIFVNGTIVYALKNDGTIAGLDVSVPSDVSEVTTYTTSGDGVEDFTYADHVIVVRNGDGNIETVNAYTADSIYGAATYHVTTGTYLGGFSMISNGILYATDGDCSLQIFNISNIGNPQLTGTYQGPSTCVSHPFVSGGRAYTIDDNQKLEVLDITAVPNPSFAATFVNGNVGIGTQTPLSALDVNGNIALSGGYNRYINFAADMSGVGQNGFGIRDKSGVLQYKNAGGEWVNFGSSAGNLAIAGYNDYLNFNTDEAGTGNGGYGFRDYYGTMQYKNSGDPGWTDFNSGDNSGWTLLDDGSTRFGAGDYALSDLPTKSTDATDGLFLYPVNMAGNTDWRYYVDDDSGDSISFYGNSCSGDCHSAADAQVIMHLDGSGNVGIGTDSPSSKLAIAGYENAEVAATISNTMDGSLSTAALHLLANDSPDGMALFLNSGSHSDDGGTNTGTLRNDVGDLRLQSESGNGIQIAGSTGYVGIGTSTPTAMLAVAGSMQLSSDGDTYINFNSGGESDGYGIRMYSGHMQYRNTDGNWTDMGSGGGGNLSYNAASTSLQTLVSPIGTSTEGTGIVGDSSVSYGRIFMGQTITPQSTGVVHSIEAIVLPLSGGVDHVSVAIYDAPGGNLLTQADEVYNVDGMYDGGDYQDLTWHFSSNFVMRAGVTYYVEFRDQDSNQMFMGQSGADSYPRGQMYISNDSHEAVTPVDGFDLDFILLYGGAPGGLTNIGSISAPLVLDVTGTTSPSTVGSVGVGNYPLGLAVQGRYAYVANSNDGSMSVIDVSDSTSPTVVSTLTGLGVTEGEDAPEGVAVQGKYAYITSEGDSTLYVADISNPHNPTIVGRTPFAEGGQGDQPDHVVVSGHYAYVTDEDVGLVIVDISNPQTPRVVGKVAGGSPEQVAVQGRYAYMANTDDGTLDVIDISDPAQPHKVGSSEVGNSPYGVDVQGRYAYVTDDNGGSLYIVDVQDPTAPSTVTSIHTGMGEADYLSVVGRYAYVSGTGGVAIIDISNAADPVFVGTSDTVASMQGIEVQGRYAYVVDSTNNQLVVLDLGGSYIQNLEAGALQASTLSVQNGFSAGSGDVRGGLSVGGLTANGPVAFNSLLKVFGGGGNDGVKYTATYRAALGNMTGAPSVYFSHYAIEGSNSGSSFEIVDIQNPAAPTVASTYTSDSGTVGSIAVGGNYAFFANDDSNIEIVDISNPKNPTFVDTFSDETHSFTKVIGIEGHFLYAIDTDGLVVKIDLGSLDDLSMSIDSVYTPGGGPIVSGHLDANNGYFLDAGGVIEMVDLGSMSTVSIYESPSGPLVNFSLSGSYIYALDENNEMQVARVAADGPGVDITEIGNYTTAASCIYNNQAPVVNGHYAFIINCDYSVEVVDVSNPAAPSFAGTYTSPTGSVGAMSYWDNHLYAIDFASRLEVIDVTAPVAPTAALFTGGRVGIGTSNPLATLSVSGQGGDSINQLSTFAPMGVDLHIPYAAEGNYVYAPDGDLIDIIDESDPAKPVMLASYTANHHGGDPLANPSVSGNILAFQTTDNVIELADVGDKAQPTLLSDVVGPDGDGLAYPHISGHYLYALDTNNYSLQIYDISSPTSTSNVGSYSNDGSGLSTDADISVSGNFVYVLTQDASIDAIDVHDPTSPVHTAYYVAHSGDADTFQVGGQYLFVKNSGSNIEIVNISSSTPAYISTYNMSGGAHDLLMPMFYQDHMYVTNGDCDLEAVNIINPASPTLASTYSSPTGCAGQPYITDDGHAYVISDNDTIEALDIRGISQPTNAATFVNGRVGIGTVSPLATLDVNGNVMLSGDNRYLNFGDTAGATGYGIRDNNGTLQFKNSDGDWTNLASSTNAWASNEGGINYTDGTVSIGTTDPQNAMLTIKQSSLTGGGEEVTDGDFSSDPAGHNWDVGAGWTYNSGDGDMEFASTTAGAVVDQYLVTGGTGYNPADELDLDGGNGDAAYRVDTVSGPVTHFTIVSGGSGWSIGDDLTVNGGDDNATIHVDDVDGDGAITAFTITNGGTGYEIGGGDDTYWVGAVGGGGALFHADGGTGAVATFHVINEGTGYVEGVYDTLTDGGGSGAQINAITISVPSNWLFESGSPTGMGPFTVSLDVGGTAGSVDVCLDAGTCHTYYAGDGSVSFSGGWSFYDPAIIAIRPSDDFVGTIDNVSVTSATSQMQGLTFVQSTGATKLSIGLDEETGSDEARHGFLIKTTDGSGNSESASIYTANDANKRFEYYLPSLGADDTGDTFCMKNLQNCGNAWAVATGSNAIAYNPGQGAAVGIGIDAPRAALDVVGGDLHASYALTFAGYTTTSNWPIDGSMGADNYLYTAEGSSGWGVYDVSDPTDLIHTSTHTATSSVHTVAADGTLLYIGDGSVFEVFDVSDPSTPSELGSYDTGSSIGDIVVRDGNAYIAGNGGLTVLDVSAIDAMDPGTPTLVSTFATDAYAGWLALQGNYAYVSEEGEMEVVNMSNIHHMTSVVVPDLNAVNGGIAVSGHYAYVTRNTGDSNSFAVVDIASSTHPVVMGYANIGTGRINTSIAADGNYAYVADGEIDSVYIINVANPADPQIVGYQNTHSASDMVVLAGSELYVGENGVMESYDIAGNSIAALFNNGNVGIGTEAPLSMLDINGNAAISGYNRYLNFAADTAGVGSDGYGIRDNDGTMEYKNDSGEWLSFGNSAQFMAVAGYNGYLNFNTDNYGDGIGGYGIRDDGGTMKFKNQGDPGWTAFGTGSMQWTQSGSDIAYNDGDVSIGSGSFAYESSTGVTSIDNLSIGALQFPADAGVVSWIDLPVTDTPMASTSESYTASIGGESVLTIYGEADGEGGVENLSVGVGTTTPWTTFGVNGTVSFTNLSDGGGLTALCLDGNNQVVTDLEGTCIGSTERIKHDIQGLTISGTSTLMQLTPSSFVYNKDVSSTTRWGFIAEDLASTSVTFIDQFDADGKPLTINPISILSVVVKAIQELTTAIQGFAEHFTTKEVDTQKLCVGDTCVSEDELKALLKTQSLEGSHPSASAPTPSAPTSDTGTSDASDTPSADAPDAPADTSNADASADTPSDTVDAPADTPSDTTPPADTPSPDPSTDAPGN